MFEYFAPLRSNLELREKLAFAVERAASTHLLEFRVRCSSWACSLGSIPVTSAFFLAQAGALALIRVSSVLGKYMQWIYGMTKSASIHPAAGQYTHLSAESISSTVWWCSSKPANLSAFPLDCPPRQVSSVRFFDKTLPGHQVVLHFLRGGGLRSWSNAQEKVHPNLRWSSLAEMSCEKDPSSYELMVRIHQSPWLDIVGHCLGSAQMFTDVLADFQHDPSRRTVDLAMSCYPWPGDGLVITLVGVQGGNKQERRWTHRIQNKMLQVSASLKCGANKNAKQFYVKWVGLKVWDTSIVHPSWPFLVGKIDEQWWTMMNIMTKPQFFYWQGSQF